MYWSHQIDPGNKTSGNVYYDLLESNFITVNMFWSSSDRSVLSWTYKNYKYVLSVETYDILMETQNSIWFEILIQEFYHIFDYTLQEGPRIKLLNISIIQSELDIFIYHKYHIIKNIIQWYWEKKTKDEVKLQKSPFPEDIYLKINYSWIHLSLEKS